MILLFHLFIGAVIAAKVTSLPFAILFAFLSHYFLDFFPHNEYLLKNIENRKWKKSKIDFLKLGIDLLIGLFLVLSVFYITRANYLLIIACSLSSILPDILLVLNRMFPGNKILEKNSIIHRKVHFFKYKIISLWWRLFTQLLVILIGFVVVLKI